MSPHMPSKKEISPDSTVFVRQSTLDELVRRGIVLKDHGPIPTYQGLPLIISELVPEDIVLAFPIGSGYLDPSSVKDADRFYRSSLKDTYRPEVGLYEFLPPMGPHLRWEDLEAGNVTYLPSSSWMSRISGFFMTWLRRLWGD